MIVVPITPTAPRQGDILRGIARDLGLPFLDTAPLTVDDPTLRLPGDGHSSPACARRMAEIVADHIRR